MRWIVGSIVLASIAGTGGSLAAQRLREPRGKVREFMRPKLAYSQKVLEGLVLEDFDAIAQNAKALGLLSEAADWQVLPGLEYTRYSAEFRRIANDLSRQANAKNLDGVNVAYLQLTMNCVDCHKHVRSQAKQRPPKKPSKD